MKFKTDLWGQVKEGLEVERINSHEFPMRYKVGDRPWLIIESTTNLPGDPDE